VKRLTRGLVPPDPPSLCPLSSAEFVEPPPEKNSWVRHCYLIASVEEDGVGKVDKGKVE
jgi:hypothetical protein